MTGCGRCQMLDGAWEVTVELKTVNHRFLDVSCRLPRTLSFLEEKIRRELAGGLKRGHVDVFVTVRSVSGDNGRVTVDEPLALAYDACARRMAELTGRADDLTVSRLMALEGVATPAEAEIDEESVGALCERVARAALEQVDAMRKREGAALMGDLNVHLDACCALREKILARAPQVTEDYRARLTQRLSQLPIEPVDPQRLAQEVALLTDRCAIDEELSRLESHLRQLRVYLAAEGEIGKKMDFLVQEMNREANTIGSKAGDASIAQWVVDLKSEIEKLREQIQNVE